MTDNYVKKYKEEIIIIQNFVIIFQFNYFMIHYICLIINFILLLLVL